MLTIYYASIYTLPNTLFGDWSIFQKGNTFQNIIYS